MKKIGIWLCGLLAITVIECQDIGKGLLTLRVCQMCIGGYEYIVTNYAGESVHTVQVFEADRIYSIPKKCK